MSEEMLRTEHVSKSFGRVTALRDVSIRLPRAKSWGFSAITAPANRR